MTTPRRVVDDAVIEAIRQAPPGVKNAALAKEHGLSPQYVGRIRKGLVIPRAAMRPASEVDAAVLEIAGDGGVMAKQAKAVELLFDGILLELEDIRRAERTDGRTKRLSVVARALKDAAECAATLRKGVGLAGASDDEIRKALGLLPYAKN